MEIDERPRARDVIAALRARMDEMGARDLHWALERPVDESGAAWWARVHFAVPYDRVDDLRTLTARFFESATWVDLPAFAIIPFATSQRYGCRFDLVVFDPSRVFKSAVAKRAFEVSRPEDSYEAVTQALDAEIEKMLAPPAGSEWREIFEEHLRSVRMAAGGGPTRFETLAPTMDAENRDPVSDLRLCVDLRRLQQRAHRDIDEWIERESRLHKGRTSERGAWIDIPRVDGGAPMKSMFTGTNTIFEVRSPPSGAPLSQAPASVDAARVEGYEPARQRWLGKGFAEAEYRLRGHRDARWDDAVVEAHARYLATPAPGDDPKLLAIYEEILARGCKDGVVAYRAGVCALLAREESRGTKHFRSAAEWIPANYSDCPYASSAAHKTAEAAEKRGDLRDAIVWARRAAGFSVVDPSIPAMIVRLEEIDTLATIASRGAVDLRALEPVPGLVHAAPVTSLEISPDATHVLSADALGHLQISEVIPADVFPDLNPLVRIAAHAPGPTVVFWFDPVRFLSAGADGLLFLHRSGGTRRAIEVVERFTHSAPLTALGPPLPGSRAIASAGDARGRVFQVQPDLRLTPLAPTGHYPVLRILLCGEFLIVVDETGRLSRVDTGGSTPIPCEIVAPDAVDVTADQRLLAGIRAGLSVVDPRGGTSTIVECPVVGPVVCAREDAQSRYRVASNVQTVGVRALVPNLRGVTIARPGVRALSVDFDARILATADADHRLALSAWGN